jgi:hypothetical protein
MKAYRIVDWWKYEITSKGRLATAKTSMKDIRKTPLVYVRFPVHGHSLTADYRRMVRRAGELAAACDGLYKMLVGLAGNQVREYRGWILDDRQRILNPGQVAELLFLPEEQVQQIYAILMCEDVKWLELVEFPKSLCRFGKAGGKLGGKRGAVEKNGVALNETETVKDKDKFFDSRIGVPGEKNVQPQAQPQASVSGPDTGPGPDPVSASEKPTVSDSVAVPVPVTDSASQPGAGPGAEGSVPLTDNETIFELDRQRKKATLELSQIIRLRTNSDTTTILDIYTQLQQRMIAGSPYHTARQCWRADKPIAMFVAAMKKPPFYYVPKKLSVLPGKYVRDKKIH